MRQRKRKYRKIKRKIEKDRETETVKESNTREQLLLSLLLF